MADKMMMKERSSVCSVKCRYCDILLVGREQFIGHMLHTHEFSYEQLQTMWESIARAHQIMSVETSRNMIKR